MNNERSEWLDTCRALAVLGVVTHHCTQVLANELPLHVRNLLLGGQYGVQLFFIISAITIKNSLQRSPPTMADGFHKFWIRRYFRIAPLYYFGIVISAAWWWIAAQQPNVKGFWHEYTISNVLANILFIHTFVPTAANNLIVPGGWSIGVEMVFYAIAPLICCKQRSKIWLGSATIGAWAIGSLLSIFARWLSEGSFHISNNSYLYFWFPQQVFIFLLGFLVYEYFGRQMINDAEIDRRVISIAALLFVIGYALVTHIAFDLNVSSPIVLPIVAVTMAALSICAGIINRYAPGRSILVRIGQLSYSIYITHFLFQNIFLYAARRGILVPELLESIGAFATLLCITSIVLVLSYTVSLFTKRHIEDRFIRWGKQLTKHTLSQTK